MAITTDAMIVTPLGIDKRAVCLESKPKLTHLINRYTSRRLTCSHPLIKVAWKAVVAPLGILEMVVIRLNSHVCGSLKHSMACFGLKCLFSIPVWLTLSRSIAQIFSSFFNREVIGLSGIRTNTIIPRTTVITPRTRNKICHEVKVFPV